MPEPFASHETFIVPHTQMLLDSFRHWLGRDLIPRHGDPAAEARAVFDAPFAVLSAGPQEDPILNYGNGVTLRLWAMDWETLTQTPSRQTAEPVHRAARAEFLRRVREQGYVDDYSGIRISARGDRFRIENVIVWNLQDSAGNHAGQAATFASWTPCPRESQPEG